MRSYHPNPPGSSYHIVLATDYGCSTTLQTFRSLDKSPLSKKLILYMYFLLDTYKRHRKIPKTESNPALWHFSPRGKRFWGSTKSQQIVQSLRMRHEHREGNQQLIQPPQRCSFCFGTKTTQANEELCWVYSWCKFVIYSVFIFIHPGRLTWNLQITHLERKMIFQTSMIMVHVNLPGCIYSCKTAIFSSHENSNQPTLDTDRTDPSRATRA